MKITFLALSAACAALSLAEAVPAPRPHENKPRYYFPRVVKRQTEVPINTTSSTTTPQTTTSEPTTSRGLLDGLTDAIGLGDNDASDSTSSSSLTTRQSSSETPNDGALGVIGGSTDGITGPSTTGTSANRDDPEDDPTTRTAPENFGQIPPSSSTTGAAGSPTGSDGSSQSSDEGLLGPILGPITSNLGDDSASNPTPTSGTPAQSSPSGTGGLLDPILNPATTPAGDDSESQPSPTPQSPAPSGGVTSNLGNTDPVASPTPASPTNSGILDPILDPITNTPVPTSGVFPSDGNAGTGNQPTPTGDDSKQPSVTPPQQTPTSGILPPVVSDITDNLPGTRPSQTFPTIIPSDVTTPPVIGPTNPSTTGGDVGPTQPPPPASTTGVTLPPSTPSQEPTPPTVGPPEPSTTGITTPPPPPPPKNETEPDVSLSTPTTPAFSPPVETPAEATPSATPTETKAPESIVPTATNSATAITPPSTIVTAPPAPTTTSESKDKPSTTNTAMPSDVPRVITPEGGVPVAPENSTLIQIAFKKPLHYEFVVGSQIARDQIFTYIPIGVSYGLNISSSKTIMNYLQPYNTLAKLNYITTLAMAWIPSDEVDKLSLELLNQNSLLWENPDKSVRTLISMIDPSVPLLAGQGLTPGGTPVNAGDNGGNGGDNENENSAPGSDSGSSGVKPSSVGIAVGAVAGAAVYGAAMFLVARRYKKRKAAHQRASSVQTDETPRPGENSNLMTGARNSYGSRMPGGAYTNNGRGSRNSDRSDESGRSGRTYISPPVMAENSLGWN